MIQCTCTLTCNVPRPLQYAYVITYWLAMITYMYVCLYIHHYILLFRFINGYGHKLSAAAVVCSYFLT